MKSSHFERSEVRRRGSSTCFLLTETFYGERTQDGDCRVDSSVTSVTMVSTADRPRTGHRPRDGRKVSAPRGCWVKTSHFARRVARCGRRSRRAIKRPREGLRAKSQRASCRGPTGPRELDLGLCAGCPPAPSRPVHRGRIGSLSLHSAASVTTDCPCPPPHYAVSPKLSPSSARIGPAGCVPAP